jgi:hypothetical protein
MDLAGLFFRMVYKIHLPSKSTVAHWWTLHGLIDLSPLPAPLINSILAKNLISLFFKFKVVRSSSLGHEVFAV